MAPSSDLILLASAQSSVELAVALQAVPGFIVRTTHPNAAIDLIKQVATPWSVIVFWDLPTQSSGSHEWVPVADLLAAITRLAPGAATLVRVSGPPSAGLEALHAGAFAYLTEATTSEEMALWALRGAQWAARAAVNGRPSASASANEDSRLIAERRAKNLQAVRDITTSISSASELPDVLTSTCEAAVQLFGVDHSGLVLFDEHYEQGHVAAEYPARQTVGTIVPLRGVAIEEQLIIDRCPVIIDDLAQHNPGALGPVKAIFSRFGITSILIVPIIYGHRVLGSFSLDIFDQPRAFEADMVEMCEIFAAQIAIAIAKAQQLDNLRARTLALTPHLDAQALYERIVCEAAGLLNASGAGIYSYDQQSGGLRLIASHNCPDNLTGQLLPLGEGMSGRLFSSHEPFMIVDNYPAWPERASIYAEHCPFEAVVAAPLRWRNELLGVLFVNDRLGRSFIRQEGNLLRLFADYAASALVNNEKLTRIKQLSQVISLMMRDLEAGSLDERLNLIAREAVAILGAESSGVLLVSRPGMLRLVAGYGHRPGVADIGHEFAVVNGPQSGLTGAIAALGQPVRLNGAELLNHPAVRGLPTHTMSTQCHSLLALPLFRQRAEQCELIGLIRIDNKKDRTGRSGSTIGFSEEDEHLFRLFGEAVSIAVENATLALHRQQLINSSPSSVVVNDEQGIITTFSAQATTMLGYRAEEVQQLLHVDQFFEQYAQSREIGHALNEDQQALVERRVTLVDRLGRSIPVRLSATAFYDVLGQRRGTIGYFEDLRPLVAKEQQLTRLLRLSETLRQIGDYIQSAQHDERILRVFLNGVTALYGLRFDCAALLLYHESDQSLRGACAVGPLQRVEAVAHGEGQAASFEQFITDLSQGRLAHSPLETRMRGLHLATDLPTVQALCGALDTGKWVLLAGEDLELLPADLRTAYEPSDWLMVVPLMTATRWVGLLLADRRMSREVVPQEERDLLMALAGTTALAVTNTQLLNNAISVNKQLSYLFEAGTMMVSSRPPRAILKEIVGCLREATDALWVSLFLIDAAILRDRISTREGTRFKPEKAFRTDGVSLEVMQRQQPLFFEDTAQHRERLNPIIYTEQVGSAACIPFVMRGQSLGVVWIHGGQTRTYSESQQQAIQLFVNQAAVAYESAIRVRDLDLMRQATDALARAESWEEVLQEIGEHARTVLKANQSLVWFYDRGCEQFVHEKSTGSGISRDLMEELRSLAPQPNGTSYKALRGQRIIVEDAGDQRKMMHIGQRTRDLMARCGAQSLQIIGLRLGGESLGVLYALYTTPRSFSAADAEQSQLFAENAAHALKKAMLLDRVSLSYSTALAVTQAMARGDLPATLYEIASGVKELMHCDLVSLYVYDEQRDRIAVNPTRIGATSMRVMNRPISRSANPLLEWALTARQPAYVTNVADEPAFQRSRFVRDENIRSSAVVPLRVGTSTVGAMFISYRESHRFSAEEQRTITYFAEQAAVAINTSLLALERNEQLSALKALHRAAYAVTRTASLDALFQTIVEQAVALVRDRSSKECFAHYAHVDGHYLRFAAAYPPALLQGLRDQVGDLDLNSMRIGVTGQVLRSGKLRNISDVTRETDYIHFAHLPEIKAELAVPVLRHGVPVGVINLESPEYGAFTAHDEYAVEALAEYMAVAIETRQLQLVHEQMQGSEHRLDVINQLTSAIAELTDLGELLHRVCDLIIAGSDRIASVWLYDQLEQVLIFDPAWSVSFKTLIANEARSGRLRLPISKGICGWVVRTQTTYRSGAVMDDVDSPHYVTAAPKVITINSELCVPIIDIAHGERRVVGVIDLQSPQADAFDARDESFLQSIARTLAGVIAREQTRQRLSAAESLALTGVAGSLHWHKTIGLINNTTKKLDTLRSKVALNDLPVPVREFLTWIDLRTKSAMHERLPPGLDPRENSYVLVHQLLRELVAQFRHQEPYADINYQLVLPSVHEAVQVRANREWLRHAVMLLIENAAMATRNEPQRCITIGTRCLPKQSYIEISIGDNGHGISPELQQRLFNEQIRSEGGMGVGVLLVRRISETYGGYVRIADPGPFTTSLVLALPIVPRDGALNDDDGAPNSM